MRSEIRIEFLEVVAVPGHERDQRVAPQRQLAEVGARAIGDDVAGAHPIAHLHHRPLIDAGVLVGPLELTQVVDVDHGIGALGLVRDPDHDARGIDLVDHAAAPGDHRRARVLGDHFFHPGADQRRLGLDQRHRLALHVGAHERAIRVVVLEERNQRRRHRDQLLGRDVDEVDDLRPGQDEVAVLPAAHQILDEAPLLRQLGVGLRDGVAPLLDRGEVDHLIGHLAVSHAAVRALDEAVLVDPRIGGETVDQADVGPLRGLDRADPAIVGGVHVAHLEAGALAGQAARAERGKAALVRDLRQRIGLVHELGQLRAAEELAHRRRHRLGVDQVVRHGGVDLDRAHALPHRPLHAQQADPELILHQFADRAHPAVAEMVDVVDFAAAVLDLDHLPHHADHVDRAQDAQRVLGLEAEARVHLDPADGRQVITLGIEEQAMKQAVRGVQVRGLAGAQHAVDVEQRVLARRAAVGGKGIADVGPHRDVIDVEHRQRVDLGVDQLRQQLGRERGARLGVDQAGLLVDQIDRDVAPDQLLRRDVDLAQALLLQALEQARRQLGARLREHVAARGVDEVRGQLLAAQTLRPERLLPALAAAHVFHLAVEQLEHAFGQQRVGLALPFLVMAEQADVDRFETESGKIVPARLGRVLVILFQDEREQQRRERQLAPAIDAHVHQVLGVELEVEPRAAIGNDARRVQQLARAVGLAAVVVVEDARRTVHLRHDHPLGAVDHERAVVGHQRQVAHVDVLLLDVAHALGAGIVIHVPYDQAQRDAQRRGVGHAPLVAFLDVVLRLLELVLDEVQRRPLREVADREHRLEHLLQAEMRPLLRPQVHLQEALVRGALHLDQVGHHRDLGDVPEALANPLATGERVCHRSS